MVEEDSWINARAISLLHDGVIPRCRDNISPHFGDSVFPDDELRAAEVVRNDPQRDQIPSRLFPATDIQHLVACNSEYRTSSVQ